MTTTKTRASQPTPDFTPEVPEFATLLQLALIHTIRVFEVENKKTGQVIVVAYCRQGAEQSLYTDSDGARHGHLFFWLCGWDHDKSPEDVALQMLGDKYVLRPN